MAAATTACGGGDSDDGLVDGDNDDNDNDDTDENPDGEVDDTDEVSDNIDAGPTVGECDPLTQMPCTAGERCTWIWDSLNDPSTEMIEPTVGHLGCAFDGTIPEAGQCTRSGPTTTPAEPEACVETAECGPGLTCIDSLCRTAGTGAATADDCERGNYCIAGTCKSICDTAGAEPSCGANASCNRYSGIFISMGMTVAGVCDPKCDPLLQTTVEGSLAACNSLDAANPNTGCFTTAGAGVGGIGFSCARVPPEAKGLTNYTPAYGPDSGGAYANGCEAGYLPFWADADDNTITVCAGTCAPADSDDSSAALIAANIGDATKMAKLHNQPAPRVGDGVCQVLKKGSAEASNCKYIWSTGVNDNDDETLIDNPFNDILGVCFAYSQYTYDNDEDPATAEIGNPGCQELPIETGTVDPVHEIFAWQLGCYNSTRTAAIVEAQPPRPSAKINAKLRRMNRFHTITAKPGERVMKHVLL
jgi:hypothetical protein